MLAVISTHLPAALRTFLLTLAVVDDLLAITIIAVFYTGALQLAAARAGAGPARRCSPCWCSAGCGPGGCCCPLAVATWVLVHESGVHATVAGVLLGFAVPVIRRAAGPGPGLAEHFEHRFRPLSAGVAVPVFAFFAAGVSIAGAGGLGASLTDPVTLGIIVGLVVGKTVGVLGATWLVQRFTRARLADGLSWWDVLGLALLAGIGFTVSLLIGELAFGAGSEQRRPRQDRRPARLAAVRAARHRRPADPQPPLPRDLRPGRTRRRRRRRSRRLREGTAARLTRQGGAGIRSAPPHPGVRRPVRPRRRSTSRPATQHGT